MKRTTMERRADAGARRKKVRRFLSTRLHISTPRGFTLLELVITLAVLSILTLGVVPIVQMAVKRQREQRLREALREMRTAIEQFHRDTIGCPTLGGAQQPPATGAGTGTGGAGAAGGQQQPVIDPRSRVCISDPSIFGVDNPDRYPPDLETLVSGVNVTPRAGAANPLGGGGLAGGGANATDQGGTLATKKKSYLRQIPVDPMTGERDWDVRSLYDAADTSSWGGENVFDVRSKSKATALNGEKYSEW